MQAEVGGASQLNILVREGRYARDEPSLGLCYSIDTTTMQVNARNIVIEEIVILGECFCRFGCSTMELFSLFHDPVPLRVCVVIISINGDVYRTMELRVAVHLSGRTQIYFGFPTAGNLMPPRPSIDRVPNLCDSLSKRNRSPLTWPEGLYSWTCGMAMR